MYLTRALWQGNLGVGLKCGRLTDRTNMSKVEQRTFPSLIKMLFIACRPAAEFSTEARKVRGETSFQRI